jgi:hypothetical protein
VEAGSGLAAVVFVLFALLSALGVFQIGAHFRGRRTGLLAALVTLGFFAVLAAAMLTLFAGFAAP